MLKRSRRVVVCRSCCGAGVVCAAILAECVGPTAGSTESQALPQDGASDKTYVLRYYGSAWGSPWGGSGVSQRLTPGEVCYKFPAVCVDLQPGRCVEAPPELAAPYNAVFEAGSEVGYYPGLPRQSAEGPRGAKHLLLRMDEDTGRGFLWSGCDAGCGRCVNGTGLVLAPIVSSALCEQTAADAVFFLIDTSKFHGVANAHINCFPSLRMYNTDREGSMKISVGLVAIGATAVVTMVLTLYVVLACVCRAKLRRDQSTAADFRMDPPDSAHEAVVDVAEIERRFPAKPAREALPEGATPSSRNPPCVVCLQLIEGEHLCRTISCGHVFHAGCITEWWTHQPRTLLTCPTCRKEQTLRSPSCAAAADEAPGGGPDGLP